MHRHCPSDVPTDQVVDVVPEIVHPPIIEERVQTRVKRYTEDVSEPNQIPLHSKVGDDTRRREGEKSRLKLHVEVDHTVGNVQSQVDQRKENDSGC